MRRDLIAITLALSLAGPLVEPAPVSIHIQGTRVDIRATGVPLAQVLNGVAAEARMSVVYDSTPPPQDPVTVDIRNATLSEAITELLRGHGLVYVAKMDSAGQRVETLVLTTGAAGHVHLAPASSEPPPTPEPMLDIPQPEYTPEPQPVEPFVPPQASPTAGPSGAWTPQPLIIPGSLGPNGAVTAAPTSTPMLPDGQMPGAYSGHDYSKYTPTPDPAANQPHN